MLGYVYKITSPQTNKVYYGSTILSLKERFRLHYVKYKRYVNGKITKLQVFDILQFDDSKIELLEEYEVQNQKELLVYERKYIIENDCCNKVVPLRTYKERIKNTKAIWYLNNRERLIQKQTDYKEKQKLIKQNIE
jgi:hypothetical protein